MRLNVLRGLCSLPLALLAACAALQGADPGVLLNAGSGAASARRSSPKSFATSSAKSTFAMRLDRLRTAYGPGQ